MKQLTKVEEQIMQILWKLEKGFINDILENIELIDGVAHNELVEDRRTEDLIRRNLR